MTLMQLIREDVREERRAWQSALDLAEEMVREAEADQERIDVLYLREHLRDQHPEIEPRFVTLAIERALRSRPQR